MRRPVVSNAIAVFTFLGLSCASQAQDTGSVSTVPRVILSTGYSFIYANDPPGGAHKFDINGGFFSVDYNFRHWLGVTGEFTGGEARQISPIGQNLYLFTYTAGPRFAWRPHGRITLFGQVLWGRAEGTHSYFPTGNTYTTTANAFAVSDGGGISYRLTHRYSLHGDVRFLHTTFNNGINSSENQLEFNAGISVKFGHYTAKHFGVGPASYPHAEPMPEPMSAPPPPPPTAPVPEATAAPAATPATAPPPAVEAAPPVPAPAIAPPAEVVTPPVHNDDPHPPVGDIYFDYDKTDLRPDAETPLRQVALYLQANPGQRLLIAGFSDERGAEEHNRELGELRAMAVRDELVRKGVNSNQITVVTYGKGAEICLKSEEACYQRNRRITFMWLK